VLGLRPLLSSSSCCSIFPSSLLEDLISAAVLHSPKDVKRLEFLPLRLQPYLRSNQRRYASNQANFILHSLLQLLIVPPRLEILLSYPS
jgi:hypothetical protein